jgi:dTDP-glucose 4,6-dehydratase
MLLVTGGAGFIGSNFIAAALRALGDGIVNLDKLTYAGNPRNLDALRGEPRYAFVRGDIADRALVRSLLARQRPRAIVHFAAESHVDRSIHGPAEFVQTNVFGTFCLLEEARAYAELLGASERAAFRFLNVSTDEVYGSLAAGEAPFTESTPFAPNSPYAASKAAADHLVRAYQRTYGLATITTHCSNNHGPFQFPEKLIPLMIRNALAGEPLPVYGDGGNVRDWLHVDDHCSALLRVLEGGRPGETYNVGGGAERGNLEVVRAVCRLLDAARPRREGPHEELIRFVADRAGHDRRYAVDAGKLTRELGWTPRESFESGLARTVSWYLANARWVEDVATGAYQEWIRRNYAARGAA